MSLRDFFPRGKTVADFRREGPVAWWEFILAVPLLAAWVATWAVVVAVLAAGACVEAAFFIISDYLKGLTMNQKKLIAAILAAVAFLLLSGCAPSVKWTMQDRDRMADLALQRGADYREIAHDIDSFERLFTGYPELAPKE